MFSRKTTVGWSSSWRGQLFWLCRWNDRRDLDLSWTARLLHWGTMIFYMESEQWSSHDTVWRLSKTRKLRNSRWLSIQLNCWSHDVRFWFRSCDLRMLYVLDERDQIKTAKFRLSKNRTSIFVAFYEHLFDPASEYQTANFLIPLSRNHLKWKEVYRTFSICILM